MPGTKVRWGKLQTVGALVFLVLVIGGTTYLIARQDFNAEVARAGVYAPLIFIFLKALTIVVAPLEGTPLYLIADTLFGRVAGFTYIVLGDLIGHGIAFGVSRWYGRRALEWLLTPNQTQKVDRMLGYIGTPKRLIVARVLLVSFGDVLSYAAGLTKLSTFHYWLITVPFAVASAAIMMTIGTLFINGWVSYLVIAVIFALIPLLLIGVRSAERWLRRGTATQ